MLSDHVNQPVQIRPGLIVLVIIWFLISVTVACLQAPHPLNGKPMADKSWWEWMIYPLEQNASSRLPSAPNKLLSIYFAKDQKHGWIVGYGGTILATADSGQTWEARSNGVKTDLYSVQFSGDGQYGLTVGGGGMILSTADGRKTWTARNSGVLHTDLYSVQFASDGQHGWAVGSGGTILATVHGLIFNFQQRH